jgi:histidinol dehydrogenase
LPSFERKYPSTYPEDWINLAKRPLFEKQELNELVKRILSEVKTDKDLALARFTKEFDDVNTNQLAVGIEEINEATDQVSTELKLAINIAKENIEKFHTAQKVEIQTVETSKGVLCWQKSIGIDKVGLYIPGGSAPLFSTLLMLGIPAKLAACKEVILCTPPNKQGKINPAIC